MTISERVKQVLTENNCMAFTLYGGYASTYAGQTLRFPVGVTELEKRNENGRVVLARYRYADNSTLEYRHNTKTERFTLTSKASA